MSIELYVFPPSPRAIKVIAAANHLGLDYTMRMLDFSKGEHMAPAYAALKAASNADSSGPSFGGSASKVGVTP